MTREQPSPAPRRWLVRIGTCPISANVQLSNWKNGPVFSRGILIHRRKIRPVFPISKTDNKLCLLSESSVKRETARSPTTEHPAVLKTHWPHPISSPSELQSVVEELPQRQAWVASFGGRHPRKRKPSGTGRKRSDLRNLIRARVEQAKGICLALIMASGSYPGNGPVLDPAMKHTSRS